MLVSHLREVSPHLSLSLKADCDCFIDDFDARGNDELTLRRGDKLELIELDDGFGDGWFLGKDSKTGTTGLFPGGALRLKRSRMFLRSLTFNPTQSILPSARELTLDRKRIRHSTATPVRKMESPM